MGTRTVLESGAIARKNLLSGEITFALGKKALKPSGVTGFGGPPVTGWI
jgi:hypothetical protein